MGFVRAASRLIPGLALAILTASAQPVLACPSDLDVSFGNGGVAERLEADEGFLKSFFGEPFVGPSGDILVPGEIDFRPSILRYHNDGELDPTFGEDGVAKIVVPNGSVGGLSRIGIQADGRIVAAGYVRIFDGEFATMTPLLVRLDATGKLDPAFGDGGIVLLPTASQQDAFLGDVVVRGDGILVAIRRLAYEPLHGTPRSSVLYFTANGNPDPAFGNVGVVTVATPTDQTYLTAIARLGDDSVVVSGFVGDVGDTLLAKLRSDGAPDLDFGGAGVRITRTNLRETPWNMEVDSLGRILVAGDFGSGQRKSIFVRRYLPNGKRDRSYGRHGRGTMGFARRITAGSLAVTRDGYAVVPAYFESGLPAVRGGIIARFGNNGERDQSFGRRGVKRVYAGPATQLSAIAVQPDQKLVVTGKSRVPLQNGFAPLLLRLNGGTWNDAGQCPAVCGDGVVSGTELCDDGAGNSNTTPDACRSNCSPPECGDWVLDTGEGCEDGNRNDSDGCSSSCLEEFCGDGVIQFALGEECDDGIDNRDAPDSCQTDCKAPRCDDDNANEYGLCSPFCICEYICGDGVRDLPTGEECDDGVDNSYAPDACRPTCDLPYCGDGVKDSSEACDDGNEVSSDGCLPSCRLD